MLRVGMLETKIKKKYQGMKSIMKVSIGFQLLQLQTSFIPPLFTPLCICIGRKFIDKARITF